jgi:formylglycine-generating enzyme required for sulfatase activity
VFKKLKIGTRLIIGLILIFLLLTSITLFGINRAVTKEVKKKKAPEGMVFVNGGCYQMGCRNWTSECEDNEKPVHEVCIDDFYISKYEVTQKQWREVMGSNPSHFNECGDNCPVEQVSWNDAQQFIRILNQKTGKNYRLPTEAEWEYACRSGGKQEKYAGGSDPESVSWYSSNSGNETLPVGQKRPNGLGLYDMSGNVWEWVYDWMRPYPISKQLNPKGPLRGANRVDRGGSWRYASRDARCSNRSSSNPDSRYSGLGFRLAGNI